MINLSFLLIDNEYINVKNISSIRFGRFKDKRGPGEQCKISYGGDKFIILSLYDSKEIQPKDRDYEDVKKEMTLIKEFLRQNTVMDNPKEN